MKLVKILSEQAEGKFTEALPFGPPRTVQGCVLEKAEGLLRITGKRFKLFSGAEDYVKICAGNGFIKWARGEAQFSAGDIFLAEGIGEYEVNGAERFLVARR
jgi:hypothetical protein